MPNIQNAKIYGIISGCVLFYRQKALFWTFFTWSGSHFADNFGVGPDQLSIPLLVSWHYSRLVVVMFTE